VRITYVVFSLVLTGCIARGPTVVEPDIPFAGIEQVLREPDSDAQLNIMMVHGMGADVDQDHDDIIKALQPRLQLESVTDTPEIFPLVSTALPSISLGGTKLWTDLEEWQKAAPRLRIRRYRATSGQTVNVYSFEYWHSLVRLKCRLLVAEDARVIGSTSVSEYCRDHGYSNPRARMGGKPLLFNRRLKAEVVEWGFGDAVIAVSGFREILRQAIREAMALQLMDAIKQASLQAEPRDGIQGLQSLLGTSNSPRFAIITRSLGSYVLLDALEHWKVSSSLTSQFNLSADLVALQMAAPALVVCNARQVHMLANQFALLQLSEITVDDDSAPTVGISSLEKCEEFASVAGLSPSRQPIQVVAYHEPNDLLSFYVKDEGEHGTFTFTNVISSYAKVWIPWLVANPADAHTGQGRIGQLMDFLAFGRGVKQ
jgi:hypothetical protein